MSGQPWDNPPDHAPAWEWDDANTTADKPARPRLRAIPAAQAMAEPVPVEIVEGLLWAGCVTVLVAESSAGKTFVALDLAAAISAGFSWHGRDVTRGSVIHIGYEGDAIGLRLRALSEHRHAQLDHVYRLRAAAPLSPLVSREGELSSLGELDVLDALRSLGHDLETDGKPPIVLIVVDTVRASLQGSEDSSEGVSAYLRAIRRLLEALPTAAALLVHHAGWQDGDAAKKRERGSSAFRGNVDATVYLTAGDYDRETESAALTLTTHKVRDGEKPPELHFIRQRVTFTETDRRGKPLTSCVIDPDLKTDADYAAERTQKASTAAAADDLRVLRVMAQHPTVTAQATLRQLAGLGKDPLSAAIARLVQRDCLAPPEKQRQPYTLTPLGRHTLASS